MKRLFPLLALCAVLCSSAAHSFCGFYVASGDAKLFNHASQVALVRDGDRTVLTMANDFRGEPKEFAIVVPVPTWMRQVYTLWPDGSSSVAVRFDGRETLTRAPM